MSKRGTVGMVGLLLALVAGCGAARQAVSPSVAATTPVPVPTRTVPRQVAERCQLDVPGEVVDLVAPDGRSRLGAVAYGEGPTAVVLLHQTGRSGLCGWVTYARWLAGQGVLALAVDDCIRGSSSCTEAFTRDVRGQVALAVAAARERGASRVAVVGASMGGARALGVGQRAGADVVVDLSGPVTWEGVPAAGDAAAATTVPLLVVTSAGDRGIDARALEAAVDRSPAARTRFVLVPGDAHGWDLTMDTIAADAAVTDEGRLVLDWVRADG